MKYKEVNRNRKLEKQKEVNKFVFDIDVFTVFTSTVDFLSSV